MRSTRWIGIGISLLVLLFGLLALGQCELASFDMEYVDQNAAEAAGWEFYPPWKLVSKAAFTSEPDAVRAFPSGEKAMYFGEIRNGKGTYALDGAFWAELWSPRVPLTRCENCQYVSLSFKYLREVEYYTKGSYDVTTVYLVFESDTQTPSEILRQKVWYMDSKTPSVKQWQSFATEDPIKVPDDATHVRVMFSFDMVDGYANNYFGWMVDDVKLVCGVAPLKILTEALGQGHVGTYYRWPIRAVGGFNGGEYEWSIVSGRLPARLALAKLYGGPGWGLAEISGVPEEAGTFEFTVQVKSGRDLVAQKTFVLAVSAEARIAYWREDFDPVQPGWTGTGLWHVTDWVCVPYPPGIVMYDNAAYYGKAGCPASYDEGGRTRGYFTSPAISLDPGYAGYTVKVAFKSWRWVEEYAGGSYDKTWVEVKMGTGEWIKIWERDSRNPSEKAWTWEEVDTGLVVPSGTAATGFQIRFGFDSVDGYANNYVGWIIDEVTVILEPTPLEIVTECPLPDGWVGLDYRVVLEAKGGVRDKVWEAEGLPSGLSVQEEPGGVWVIAGVPRQPTGREPAQVRLRVFDAERNMAEKTCSLTIRALTVLFKENFENEATWSEWTRTGLWCRTDYVKGVDLGTRGYVAYYGIPTAGNYDTGSRTQGELTSPPFEVLDAPYAQVSFEYWREVESYAGDYDRTYVEVRFKVGGAWQAWTPYWAKNSSHPSERTWTPAEFTVTVPTGATHMQIRFVFDSVDRYYNKFVGWLVDNVKVVKAESAGLSAAVVVPEATPRGRITVMNIPNPVRDVYTTTFLVRGVEADLIRVEIYDLTGRLVYAGEAPGNELVWHTQDMLGQYLANGVYLYKVLVKVGDTWLVSDVQKLVILR